MSEDKAKTIIFTDSETGERGVAIVRSVGESLGITLSLEKSGDVEVFLSGKELEDFRNALLDVSSETEIQ